MLDFGDKLILYCNYVGKSYHSETKYVKTEGQSGV